MILRTPVFGAPIFWCSKKLIKNILQGDVSRSLQINLY